MKEECSIYGNYSRSRLLFQHYKNICYYSELLVAYSCVSCGLCSPRHSCGASKESVTPIFMCKLRTAAGSEDSRREQIEGKEHMIRKIGVISDTHIPHFKKLPEAIWEHFAGVELVIHAGDLSILSVIDELETIAPVVAVQGNVEHEEVMLKLPIKREVVVGHCRIGIVHILGDSKTHALVARQ